jgi:hypothetical protein
LQGTEKIVFGGQNQTVTEYAVEINFGSTEAAISNEHCADFEVVCCLILEHFGYRAFCTQGRRSHIWTDANPGLF